MSLQLEEDHSQGPDRTGDGFEVTKVDAALLRVPLARPIAGASARPGITPKPFTTWDVISVTVSTRNGLSGWGLTYELRAGGEAVLAGLRHDLIPLLIGVDCFATESLWHRLYWAPTMPAGAGRSSMQCRPSTLPSGTSWPRPLT
jgi:L-alanine-DL-glutamate epimerase-like enolase superfamily enzyme